MPWWVILVAVVVVVLALAWRFDRSRGRGSGVDPRAVDRTRGHGQDHGGAGGDGGASAF